MDICLPVPYFALLESAVGVNEPRNNFMINLHESQVAELRFDSVSPGPKVIKLFSCSTQLSMKFVLLIYLKLLTTANSFLFNIAEHENFSANQYLFCLC